MEPTNDALAKELLAKENEEKLEKFKTQLRKQQFIEEIKNGLGNEIKRNPSAVKVIKKPWTTKLKLGLAKLFTKF